MSTIEKYMHGLRVLAAVYVNDHEETITIFENLIACKNDLAIDLVQLRRELIVDADRLRVLGFLPTGLYDSLTSDDRIAAFLVTMELEREMKDCSLSVRFQPYKPEQELFRRFPDLQLLLRDGELLKDDSSFVAREDGIIERAGGVCRLEPLLNANILFWTRDSFPNAPLFVRLDPHYIRESAPVPTLQEAVLMPANPRWWKRLNIHRGHGTGSQYVMESPVNPADDTEAFWEYHVRGVRCLEVHAQRRKHEYLSMMVEELVDRQETDGFVLGRCIHWDTAAQIGIDVDEAKVMHLDLAINIYRGGAAKTRLLQNMAVGGKVQDASIRTHILRVEGIAPAAMLGYARLFFVSRLLFADWLNDQFKDCEFV